MLLRRFLREGGAAMKKFQMMLGALGLIGALGLGHSLSLADVTIGQTAPGFSLPDSKGTNTTLSDYLGKYVVLEWFNYECPFVKKHYGSGNMQKFQKEYTAKGVIWLSIISSAPGQQGYCTPNKANEVKQEEDIHSSAVLLDPSGQVGHAYGAQTTPHMFVINPEGKLIYQGAIDSIASTNPEDIPKADNYVRLALDQAMAGQAVATPSTKSYGCSVKYLR